MNASNNRLRGALALVALLNLGYFFVEFFVALGIGSASLLADSADFFEDAAVNFLILVALGWAAALRARVGLALSVILLLPAFAFVWTLWRKLAAPVPPQALELTLTGAGALIINVFCAFWLARWRHHKSSLTRAAFLSARNDALANFGIIAAGLVTHFMWRSMWPDIIVGLAIAAVNIDAARAVWTAARSEQAGVSAQT